MAGGAPAGVCPKGGGAGVQSAESAPGKTVAASSLEMRTARLGSVSPSRRTLTGWLGWVSLSEFFGTSSDEDASRRKRPLAPSPELRFDRGERPNPSDMGSAELLWAAGDQRRPGAFHYSFPFLILDIQQNNN